MIGDWVLRSIRVGRLDDVEYMLLDTGEWLGVATRAQYAWGRAGLLTIEVKE